MRLQKRINWMRLAISLGISLAVWILVTLWFIGISVIPVPWNFLVITTPFIVLLTAVIYLGYVKNGLE